MTEGRLTNKFRRGVLWVALSLILLLIFLSIYGAFLGAERAKNFFSSLPLAVYWIALTALLIVGVVMFHRLVRVPALGLIHVGCILILAGSICGSQAGHKLQKKLFGIDKVPTGQMTIYEGYSKNHVVLENRYQILLFSAEPKFQSDLDNSSISQELRQEFEENQIPLSEQATVSFEPRDGIWVITDKLKLYSVRKEYGRLNIYDPIRELPFHVRLKDFQLEYYKPDYLQIQSGQGKNWRIPVEIGREIPLGEDFGTIKVVRQFESFKIKVENGQSVPYDDPNSPPNPALEVQLKSLQGDVVTRYVFERFPGHVHPDDKLYLRYQRVISDFISKLQIIENNQVVAEKNIEVNHPLYFGGYHFYQADYDHRAGQYTVLMVVSDTGLNFVYAGYAMLCIGLLWHFWLKHLYGAVTLRHVNGD